MPIREPENGLNYSLGKQNFFEIHYFKIKAVAVIIFFIEIILSFSLNKNEDSFVFVTIWSSKLAFSRVVKYKRQRCYISWCCFCFEDQRFSWH